MPNGRSTVLVVEDEFVVRLAAVEMVEGAGFTALEADGADTAVGLLETHPEIRLVFTDIYMPGSMDGLKLAAYAHGRWPPLKFIITSAWSEPPVVVDIPEGAHFHIKPYWADAIRRSLAALL